MAKSLSKRILDTNVPKIANLHVKINDIPLDKLECVLACVEQVQSILSRQQSLVLDEDGEIFEEYRNQLSLSGQDGVGDAFMKWVHDNQWSFPKEDRVKITKSTNGYLEFPNSENLNGFDRSDMKFVAVANNHKNRPAISVASDHKWWNFQGALKAARIDVNFLCPNQIQKVSVRKTKSKKI